MAKKPLNPIPNFIDIFFEAWNCFAIEDHLKVLHISRRGIPVGRLSLLIVISLWLEATSIHLMPTYGGLLLGLPVVGAYTLYLFLNNRKFELKGILKPSSDETFEDDVLIVDDSPTEKKTAKRMEGLSLQHSTSKGKRVLGHVIVALFHLGKVIKGPIDFEIKVGKSRPKRVRKKKRSKRIGYRLKGYRL